jgi:hypothetical protein
MRSLLCLRSIVLRARAERELDMDGLEQRKEEMRDTRRIQWLSDFFDDTRYLEPVGFSDQPRATPRIKGGTMVSGNYFRVLWCRPATRLLAAYSPAPGSAYGTNARTEVRVKR